jgi:hypothetical protein
VILYKLNSFNEVSWWEINQQDCKVHYSWGNRLPMQLSANFEEESYDTPEKALAGMRSKINNMRDRKGYTEEVPSFMPSLPMLCQEYKKPPNWSSIALQPKLDGIRCIVSADGIHTRTNKRITSCPHIEYYCDLLPEGIKLDGELYIDNIPMNLIESYVLRQIPSDCTMQLKLHIFDCIDLEAPFSARMDEVCRINDLLEEKYFNGRVKGIKHPAFTKHFPFSLVKTILHESIAPGKVDEIVQPFFKECIKDGYEGAIIRNADAPYEPNRRSSQILKLKEFFDDEFKIVDVIEGKGKTAIFVCETHKSQQEFKCNFKATDERKKQMLLFKANYINKWLRIEHEGMYDNGKPRCPVGVHIFEKKDHD